MTWLSPSFALGCAKSSPWVESAGGRVPGQSWPRSGGTGSDPENPRIEGVLMSSHEGSFRAAPPPGAGQPVHPLSKLKVVRVGRPLSRDALDGVAGKIRETLADVVRQLEIVQYPLPPVDQIEVALLTQALDQQVGGHILGITDADLMDESGEDFFDFMFGGKDNRNHVAVVSTRRLGSRDPGRFLARLLKVALHELGHNFGLVHHYGYVPAAGGGGYCPMTKGDFNRHGERSYVRAVIDGRGYRFCEGCRRFIRRAYQAAVS